MSSVTADLVEQKTYKEKVIKVATVIDDGFDEIVDICSDSKNSTENVSSSVQFELTNDGGILLSFVYNEDRCLRQTLTLSSTLSILTKS